MNNVTASMGLVQLQKLDSFIQRRKEIYDRYYDAFSKLDWLDLPPIHGFGLQSSYYFFWIQTNRRNELAKYLLDNDVYTTFRYWPLHKVKFFESYIDGEYPNTEYIAQHTLNIPLHQGLTDSDVDKIIELIKEFK